MIEPSPERLQQPMSLRGWQVGQSDERRVGKVVGVNIGCSDRGDGHPVAIEHSHRVLRCAGTKSDYAPTVMPRDYR